MKIRIKEFREELQLTQKELADRISNVQRNVSNWENGTSEPDLGTLVKLAELFGVSVDELLGRERESVPPRYPALDLQILQAIQPLDREQKLSILKLIESFQK